jgi:TonB family protein
MIGLVAPARPAIVVQATLVRIPEVVVRKLATRTVLPIYPAGSRNRGVKGIAVAEVNVNEKGIVTDVEILEVPDSEIGQAVIAAVKSWKFDPAVVDDKAMPFVGKLTFYFVNSQGQARVENPRRFK